MPRLSHPPIHPHNSNIFKALHRAFFIFGALGLWIASGHAQNQTYQWDSDNNSTNGVTDGAGTWATNGGNWLSGSNLANWPDQPGAYDVIAAFGNGGTAGSVTVNGTVYAGGLLFNAVNGNGYKLVNSSGMITLKDDAVLRIDGDASLPSGTGFLGIETGLTAKDLTIEKTNGGIAYLDLGTANKNLTGDLTLVGTSGAVFLRIKSPSLLNTLDKVVVNAGNTVELDGGGVYITDFEIGGIGSSNRGALRFDSNLTLAGNIKLTSESVALATENDSRTATITGSITQDGLARKLIIRQNASNAGGTVILAGANRFTAGLEIQAGNVVVGHSEALNSRYSIQTYFANSAADKKLTLNGFSVAINGLESQGGTGQVTVTNGNDASDAAATLSLVSDDGSYKFSGSLTDGTGGALCLLINGVASQILNAQNTYTGATTVRRGRLELAFGDFFGVNTTAPSDNIISAASTLNMEGGVLRVTGKSATAVSQTFNGLQVQGGSSILEAEPTFFSAPADVLINVGAITRTEGTISFILPDGAQNTTNGIRTTNADGMLGTWATVNRSDWTMVSSSNVVAFTDYTDVNRQGAGNTISSDGSSFVRIVEGGTTPNVTLTNPGITDIHSLSIAANGAVTDIDVGTGNTLRLAADGAILIGQNAERLHVGVNDSAAAENGSLTAGGADNTAGDISILNYYEGNESRINSTITDNGSGVVSVSHHGSGRTVLSGTNTYTGGTYFNGGTIRISRDEALGAAPDEVDADNLVFNGGTLNVTDVTIHENRGVILNKQGGAFRVDTSLSYAGKISGEGSLTKSGGGYFILQGDNDYTGNTNVYGGTLQVDGSTGTGAVFVVSPSSVLAGTGTVRGFTYVTSGTIKAGAQQGTGIGTLNFSDGLIFESGSTTSTSFKPRAQFDLTGGASDRLAVTGDIELTTNAQLTATLDGGYTLNLGDSWTLMTWSGMLNLNGYDFGVARNGSGDTDSSFDLPDLTALAGYDGEWWEISMANNALVISIVPEPSRATLALVAGVFLALRRRRSL